MAPIPLARARAAADAILTHILPFCLRAEIAGSVRRRRPYCADLDFVLEVDPLRRAELLARMTTKTRVITGGNTSSQNTIMELTSGQLDGLQLDFFFSRPATHDLLEPIPATFGTLLLCRTGSMAHNIWFAQQCKDQGKHWDPYRGVLAANGSVLACETEEACYAAINRPYLEPVNQREAP